MGVLEILDRYSGDICCVSWRYLVRVLEIFGKRSGDICWVSFRYLFDVLKIFYWCPVNI